MLRLSLFIALFQAHAALAEVPRVVTDIPPVHGLVAAVMDGLGDPAMILPPGADPHSYAMRPSDAAALERADVVIWVGEALTPWLAKPVTTLAGDAVHVELLDVEGTRLIEIGGDAAHDDGHGHAGVDPHAWLNPDNAVTWLHAIAQALAVADPENAARYRENAADLTGLIASQTAKAQVVLAGLRDVPYAVHHDAYRYLEDRFGLSHVFAIIPADGRMPGPRRIAELQQLARDAGVARLVADPNWEAASLAETVFEGTPFEVCPLDPLGTGIALGPGFFQAFLADLTVGLQACLSP